MLSVRSALVLAAATTVALCMGAAGCGSVQVRMTSGSTPSSGGTKDEGAAIGPPAGNRTEAHALATELLSRLRLPSGARRLPAIAAPPSLQPSLWGGAAAALDVHELFELPEPMTAATAYLSAHVPTGMSLSVTGQGSGPAGVSADIAYSARSVPAGINAAQLVLTVAPDESGGSLLRADAQVIWYPPRTAAEYIDPLRYHVLTVAVTVFNPRLHTISKVITSQAAITQIVHVLDRSQVEPTRIANCPAIFATYRLAFSVSRRSTPVVVVTATQWPCEGAQITVERRKQPPLQDAAAVVAIADRLLGFTPRA